MHRSNAACVQNPRSSYLHSGCISAWPGPFQIDYCNAWLRAGNVTKRSVICCKQRTISRHFHEEGRSRKHCHDALTSIRASNMAIIGGKSPIALASPRSLVASFGRHAFPTKAITTARNRVPVNGPLTAVVTPTRSSPMQISRSASRIHPTKPAHHDLESYNTYLIKERIDPNVSTAIGTKYEYVAMQSLKSYGFRELERVGKAGDRGIDIKCKWRGPNHTKKQPHEFPILIQCKATAPRPSMVRELEGSGATQMAQSPDILRLLVAKGKSTSGMQSAMAASPHPMAFCFMDENGNVRQLNWNTAATQRVLRGVGVTRRLDKHGGETMILTWKDRPWSSEAKD